MHSKHNTKQLHQRQFTSRRRLLIRTLPPVRLARHDTTTSTGSLNAMLLRESLLLTSPNLTSAPLKSCTICHAVSVISSIHVRQKQVGCTAIPKAARDPTQVRLQQSNAACCVKWKDIEFCVSLTRQLLTSSQQGVFSCAFSDHVRYMSACSVNLFSLLLERFAAYATLFSCKSHNIIASADEFLSDVLANVPRGSGYQNPHVFIGFCPEVFLCFS